MNKLSNKLLVGVILFLGVSFLVLPSAYADEPADVDRYYKSTTNYLDESSGSKVIQKKYQEAYHQFLSGDESSKEYAKAYVLSELKNGIALLENAKSQIELIQDSESELGFDFGINTKTINRFIGKLLKYEKKLISWDDDFSARKLRSVIKQIQGVSADVKSIVQLSQNLVSADSLSTLLDITNQKRASLTRETVSISDERKIKKVSQLMAEFDRLWLEAESHLNLSKSFFDKVGSYKKSGKKQDLVRSGEIFLDKAHEEMKEARKVYRKIKINIRSN